MHAHTQMYSFEPKPRSVLRSELEKNPLRFFISTTGLLNTSLKPALGKHAANRSSKSCSSVKAVSVLFVWTMWPLWMKWFWWMCSSRLHLGHKSLHGTHCPEQTVKNMCNYKIFPWYSCLLWFQIRILTLCPFDSKYREWMCNIYVCSHTSVSGNFLFLLQPGPAAACCLCPPSCVQWIRGQWYWFPAVPDNLTVCQTLHTWMPTEIPILRPSPPAVSWDAPLSITGWYQSATLLFKPGSRPLF